MPWLIKTRTSVMPVTCATYSRRSFRNRPTASPRTRPIPGVTSPKSPLRTSKKPSNYKTYPKDSNAPKFQNSGALLFLRPIQVTIRSLASTHWKPPFQPLEATLPTIGSKTSSAGLQSIIRPKWLFISKKREKAPK